MSRVVVVGATGHVGTYLVPRLVRAGHEGGRRRRHALLHARVREILGYRPRYTSLDALRESLRWLAANGHVDLGDQQL